MVNAKHTPGPWKSERGSGDYGRNITCDNGRRIIAETICSDHEANAHLIAAAPDLLEALQAIKDRLEISEELDYLLNAKWLCIDDAKQAITKAEGKN